MPTTNIFHRRIAAVVAGLAVAVGLAGAVDAGSADSRPGVVVPVTGAAAAAAPAVRLTTTTAAATTVTSPTIRPSTVTSTTTVPNTTPASLPIGGKLPFPAAPGVRCTVLNNFGQQRGGYVHQGEDIVVAAGGPVYAVAEGTLVKQFVSGTPGADLAGNGWRLTTSNGAYYFYAHLAGFAPGLSAGSSVHRGDVIGFVGDTGDAGPGNFHLHFEVHPNGGAAVDPLPLLDVPAVCTVLPHQA